MQRRKFITLLGGTAAAGWPRTTRAQQPTRPVVGYLNLASAEQSGERIGLFRDGLREFGLREGETVTVEYRWADGQYDRLPALAADLVRRRVAVIAATSAAAVRAAKSASEAIPIVFYIGDDPIAAGFVASLHHPGGNITGVYNFSAEIRQKQLQLLHELVPSATVIGHLVNPRNRPTAELQRPEVEAAATKLGVQIVRLEAGRPEELEAVFNSLRRVGAGGLLIAGDLFFASQSEMLAALAAHHRMPAISEYRQFAMAGGLAVYGVPLATGLYRQLGVYAARIARGAKPADLPVQQATTLELIVNLKTARSLGITVPLPLLGRADEVIE
jgi:putative ABC transport system substrate-binding protein